MQTMFQELEGVAGRMELYESVSKLIEKERERFEGETKSFLETHEQEFETLVERANFISESLVQIRDKSSSIYAKLSLESAECVFPLPAEKSRSEYRSLKEKVSSLKAFKNVIISCMETQEQIEETHESLNEIEIAPLFSLFDDINKALDKISEFQTKYPQAGNCKFVDDFVETSLNKKKHISLQIVQLWKSFIIIGPESIQILEPERYSQFIENVSAYSQTLFPFFEYFQLVLTENIVSTCLEENFVSIIVSESEFTCSPDFDDFDDSELTRLQLSLKQVKWLQSLFTFIFDKVFLSNHTIVRAFAEFSGKYLLHRICDECLVSEVLESSQEFEQFDNFIQEISILQGIFEDSHFIVPNVIDSLVTKAKDIKNGFWKTKQNNALVLARSLLARNMYRIHSDQSIEEIISCQLCESADRNFKQIVSSYVEKYPNHKISSNIFGVAGILIQLLEQVPQDQLQSTQHIIDLIQAVFPAVHEKSLSSIPQLSMLFYNDCFFMAFVLAQISFLYSVPTMDLISRIEMIGMDWFEFQKNHQLDGLETALEKFNRFQGIFKQKEKVQSSKAIVSQILHTFQILLNVWREILPLPFVLDILLKPLFSFFFSEICSYIKESTHISLEAADSLFELLDFLISQCYDEFSEMPLIEEFEELCEIRDILAPHQSLAGITKEFSAKRYTRLQLKELESLICALYEKTAKRDTLLHFISTI